LLEALAFDVSDTSIAKLEQDNSIALNNLPNELSKTDKDKNIFRFRLYEYLFMERCAIY
jgi:hypothetical protein